MRLKMFFVAVCCLAASGAAYSSDMAELYERASASLRGGKGRNEIFLGSELASANFMDKLNNLYYSSVYENPSDYSDLFSLTPEELDKKIIKAIIDTVKKSAKIQLLGAESGYDVNRTVITFAGAPEEVKKAAFACIKKSYELIDMSNHHGKHMRLGCVDVCPFIPIAKADIQDCVEIARELGAQVGGELGIPVYLYGYAASSLARKVSRQACM